MSLHVAGRAVPTGATHCWIYIPTLVGNLVNPPLMVAPAGSRFVSGALAQPNVSAFACGAKANDEIAMALKQHFDHLMQLGEVQATRVMAALVDGVQAGQTNCKDTVDFRQLIWSIYQSQWDIGIATSGTLHRWGTMLGVFQMVKQLWKGRMERK